MLSGYDIYNENHAFVMLFACAAGGKGFAPENLD
jgi:hypothetical protein